jgi:hypothetical protein
MQNAGHPLAEMALNFLSAPGKSYMRTSSCYHTLTFYLASSTDVERAFSKGGLTISRFRHALSDDSVRSSTVLGSWTELDGAIPKARILELFGDKGTRPKKKKKENQSEDTDIVLVTST